MSRIMGRKLVKTRNSRMDTVEAMVDLYTSCDCKHNCSKCSGGGSFSAREGYNKVYAADASR